MITNKYEVLKLFLKNSNDLINEWKENCFKKIRNKFLEKYHKLNEEIEINENVGIFKVKENIINLNNLIINFV